MIRLKKGKRKVDINRIITFVVRFLFIAAAATDIILAFLLENVDRNYMYTFVSLLGFILTYIPETVERMTQNRLKMTSALKCAIVLFIFAAEFLGENQNFYVRIPWWDTMLHLTSGVILAMIGFMLFYALNSSAAQIEMSPFLVAFFAFLFTIACGAIWEIFEYMGDRIFSLNMQKYLPPEGVTSLVTDEWRYDSGLIDTMQDLICDGISALVVSIFGYFSIRKRIRKTAETSPSE